MVCVYWYLLVKAVCVSMLAKALPSDLFHVDFLNWC